MNKWVLKSCMVLAFTLGLLSVDKACADENSECECVSDAFDGLNFFYGLSYGSSKMEMDKELFIGYKATRAYNEYDEKTYEKTKGWMAFVPAVADYDEAGKKAYNETLDKLTKNLSEEKTVEEIKAKTAKNADLDFSLFNNATQYKSFVIGSNSDSGVSFKNNKGCGGFVGAGYRFNLGDSGLLAGISCEMNFSSKNKKKNDLSDKDFDAIDYSTKIYRPFDEALVMNKEAYADLIDGQHVTSITPHVGKKIEDTNKALTEGQVVGLGYNCVYEYSPDTTALTEQLGVEASDLETRSEDDEDVVLVDNESNINMAYECERSNFTPSVDVSAGYKFANGRLLTEGFVGATYVKAKVRSIATDSDETIGTKKVCKTTPSIGINIAYAISRCSSLGLKARYIFNAKKNNVNVKKNINVGLYVSWHPKSE